MHPRTPPSPLATPLHSYQTEAYTSINSKLQHSSLGIETFEDWFVKIPVPFPGQNCIQIPHII